MMSVSLRSARNAALLATVVGSFGCLANSGTEASAGAEAATRVVILGMDDAALAWAASTPSRVDGEPIGTPASPDKRFREALARLQERLNEAPAEHRAATVAWDYYFPPHDGATTRILAGAFAAAPMPLVVAHEWRTPIDPNVYAPGPARFEGHPSVVRDLEVDGNQISTGAWGAPIDDFGDIHQATPMPLSVAAYAGTLVADGLDADEARAQADAVARRVSRPFTQHVSMPSGETRTVAAIELVEAAETELVSVGAVLVDDAARDSLGGAVVFIGETYPASVDKQDLRRNGGLLPGVVAHAWFARTLVTAPAPEEQAEAAIEEAPEVDELPFEPAWTCEPTYQSDGTCDCGCGAPDPDCADAGCTEPGCSDAMCDYCYDATGDFIPCE